MEDKIIIQVTKNDKQESYKTNGYLLLYLDQGTVKFTGNMELAAITPLIMKLVAEKMSR